MKFVIFLLAALLPGLALAHPGHGDVTLVGGALHLFSGPDHLLVLVAAGLSLAVVPAVRHRIGGCLLIGAALAAGMLGARWLPPLNMEPAICATLVILGGLVALAIDVHRVHQLTALALVALVHGITHGQEMPAGAAGYAVGLVVGSVAVTMATTLAAPWVRSLPVRWAVRLAGAGIAITGLILAGS